jgi:hypothetical protein
VGKDTSLDVLWKDKHYIISDKAFRLIDKAVRSAKEPVFAFKQDYLEELE